MEELNQKIVRAQGDPLELDKLIAAYLPFVKKQMARNPVEKADKDDALSIAMLTFANCVIQYREGKGSFLRFVETSIRNRLIDEKRKNKRHAKTISLDADLDGDFGENIPENDASLQKYSIEQERSVLRDEIDSFSWELERFDISFSELEAVCPKQDRARKQCFSIAKHIASDAMMRALLMHRHRIPQAELAKAHGISAKTIEKHRKYIVTLVLLLLGDYPMIRAFLPQYGEVTM